MEKNIDKLNEAYSILFILYLVLQVLNIIYKTIIEQYKVSSDVALLIILIIGFIVVKWLFRKSK